MTRTLSLTMFAVATLSGCDARDEAFGEELVAGGVSDAEAPVRGPGALASVPDVVAQCPLDADFQCDPLDPGACGRGQNCYLVDDGAVCAATWGVPPGGACQFQNECTAGHACIYGEYVRGCTTLGCCSSLCSVAKSDCPPREECVPWFADPPNACWADAGVCADVG